MVIIDPAVGNVSIIANDLRNSGKIIHVLSGKVDALEEIAGFVSSIGDVNSLHILSHGRLEALYFGDKLYDADELLKHANALRHIGAAMSPKGDIMLYGCGVAGQVENNTFLARVAQLTGRDVAGSIDSTGSALLGGDWALEATSGTVETASLSLENWPGLLFVSTATLDWTTAGNLTLNATSNFTYEGSATALQFTIAGAGAIFNDYTASFTGGTGDQTTLMQPASTSTTTGQTATMLFNAPGFIDGIKTVSFDLRNIDALAGSWDDRVLITAFDTNNVQLPGSNIVATPRQVSGQTYSATTLANGLQLDGNIDGTAGDNSPQDSVGLSITSTTGARIGRVVVFYTSGTAGTSTGVVGISDINMSYNAAPLVKVQKISNGGTSSFSFSNSTNLASTPTAIATATAGVAAPVSPTAIKATALNTAITVTESAVAGYALTGFSCTDANSVETANPASFGTFVGATRVGTIPATNVKAGADITCQFTNTRATVKVQKISNGGTTTFAFSSQTNLASIPSSILPATAGVAAPVTPTAINVTTIGTAVTMTESAVAGYILTGFACTDANSGVTGNPASFGTFVAATQVATVPAVNVVAGADIICQFTNTKSPTLSLTKALGSGRVVNTDQFTVELRTGGLAGAVVNSTASSTTSGGNNVVAGGSGTTGTFTATAGTAYTLTEAASGTTNFAQYTSTITCTDSAGLQTGLPSGAVYTPAAGLTITPVAGAVISCTLTNTAKAPTLDLTKAMSGNRVANSDQFTVALRTGGVGGAVVNVTTNSTTTGSTSVVTAGTGATGTFTATAGTAYTLTETASGTTNFAQYSSRIVCSDSAGLQVGLPTGGAPFDTAVGLTITPVAGAVISCSLINSAKSPTLAMTKALGSNRVAATDQFTVALRTGGVAGTVVNVTTNATTTGATNVVTGGTGTTGTFTATAGTAYTLTEAASGTTNFSQYTSTITCTDSAGLQTGLPSGAAYTVATGLTITPVIGAVISCTLTNTAKAPTLAMTKALGSNRVAATDQFTVALRTGGVAGTVVNVTTNATTTGTTNVVTGGTGTTGTFTAVAGTAYTLTEAAAGTTNFAQYTSAITCTDSAGLQTGLPSGAAYTVATGLAITPVAGAVISCTLTNTAKAPVLTLAKSVVNTGGGTAGASAWTLAATGPTNISGATGAAPVTAVSVGAGAYTLSESGGPADINGGAADYSASTFSCVVNGGAAVSGNAITLNLGDTTVCTITNTFVADPTLTIDKRLLAGTTVPLVANQIITYEFEVTNTGNLPVTGLNIEETAFTGTGTVGTFTPPNGTVNLAPGASTIVTATYTVSQADVDLLQ